MGPADPGERYQLDHVLRSVLRGEDDERANATPGAAPKAVLAWAAVDPDARVHRLVEVLPFWMEGNEGRPLWTPVMADLLDRYPTHDMLEALTRRLTSGLIEGSRADAMRSRKALVETLRNHARPQVRAWAGETIGILDREILWSKAYERTRDERFE